MNARRTPTPNLRARPYILVMGALITLTALPTPAMAESPASRFVLTAPYESDWTEGTAFADAESGRLVATAASVAGGEQRSIAGIVDHHTVPARAVRLTYIVTINVDDARLLQGSASGPGDASKAATSLVVEAGHTKCGDCHSSAIRYVESSSPTVSSKVTLSFIVTNTRGREIPVGDMAVRVFSQSEAITASPTACQTPAACGPMKASALVEATVQEVSVSIAYTSADLPDLVVQSLSATQNDPSSGEAPNEQHIITYSAIIKNEGKSDSISSWLVFRTYCGVDLCKFHFRPVAAIRAGESGSASVPVTSLFQLRPGNYSLEALADIYEGVAESGESNNAKIMPFTVTPAKMADLIVKKVTISPAGAEEGRIVTAHATVVNMGSRAAGAFSVRFTFDGDSDGSKLVMIPSLPPGAQADTSADWKPAAGERRVEVFVDASGSVPESDETNNKATTTSSVRAANRAPLAGADHVVGDAGTTMRLPAPGILGNDGDPDGERIRAVLNSGASSGTLQLNWDGSLTYTPNAGFVGKDSFTYRAWDGKAYSNKAIVTLEVR